jgi:hypothetical protein
VVIIRYSCEFCPCEFVFGSLEIEGVPLEIICPSFIMLSRPPKPTAPAPTAPLEEMEDAAAETYSRIAERGLASACERGDMEEVKFLLHAGVDPNTQFEVWVFE